MFGYFKIKSVGSDSLSEREAWLSLLFGLVGFKPVGGSVIWQKSDCTADYFPHSEPTCTMSTVSSDLSEWKYLFTL